MKPGQRKVTVAFALAAIVGGLAGGCGEVVGTAPGNGSHFLEACDAACGDGLACIAGVCTTTCGRDDDCTPFAAAATCVDSSSSSTRGFCDVRCDSDRDCGSLEDAEHCASGRCRTASSSEPDASAGAGAGGASLGGAPSDAGGAATGGAQDSGGTQDSGGAAGAGETAGTTGAAGTGETAGSGGTAATAGSGGTAGTAGATASGGTAGTGSTPESTVTCSYSRAISCDDCGAPPAPAAITVNNVPVSLSGGGLPSMGALPTDPTSGVRFDAPTVFGAWLGGTTDSFSVVNTQTNPDPIWPDADWVGRYGPAPGPAGSGNGNIQIRDGVVSVYLNWSSLPSNGSYACNPMTHGNHGCISQTLTCSGTAFVPAFAP